MACTPSGDESASSIKPARDRWCTDIICLLIYLLVSAATVFIGLQAIASGDPRHLLYAKDFSGQFCGNDAAVINRSYAWFPRLDRDINDAIVAGRLSPVNPSSIARFRPYALCVEACPGAFSLTNLEPYGGAVYPHAINSTPPSEYYAVSGTRTVGSYCLPTAEPAVYGARALCAKPACTDAAVANVSGTCTATLEQEAANTSGSVLTAWEAMTPEQLSVCEVLVREVQSVTYTPAAASDATLLWERQLASHADSVYASYGAIMMSSTQIIACGLVAPLLVGVVWMAVLFLFAGLFVYVALFVLLAGLIASCLYLYSKADLFSATAFAGALSNATAGALINVTIPATMSNATVAISSLGSSAITHLTLITPEAPEDENERLLYTLGALVATIALVIYIVALALLREQISRCVALVREGTLVLRSMPFVSLYPLVGQAFVGAICVYAVVVGAFITSESETTWAQIHASLSPAANTSTTTADALSIFDALAPSDRYMLFISVHLFSVLWAVQFTLACTYTTYVAAPATWYFAHEDGVLSVTSSTSLCCGLAPLAWGALVVSTKHLGSMAFGSLVVTIIWAARLVLEYIDYLVKRQSDNPPLIVRLLLGCSKCCLYCLHKSLQYVLHQAYVFIAIRGPGFCGAGCSTFNLIGQAGGQLYVNRMVGSVLTMAIAVSTPTLCAYVCFAWLERSTSIPPVWPTVVVFIGAFVIANGIAEVFQCVIDTLFVCAHIDINESRGNPRHLSDRLRDAFDINATAVCKDDDGRAGGLISPTSPTMVAGAVVRSPVYSSNVPVTAKRTPPAPEPDSRQQI